MPFTVSHAVLALPLRRTALPASAVAAGSMAPDLRLFVPFAPLYDVTHSLAWLPVTTLVAGVLWLGWRALVAPAAADLSPAWAAARFPGRQPTAASSAGRAWSTLAALALGVLGHVVWDAFTHTGRWGVSAVPVLDERVLGQPIHAWLQDLSGVLGLVILAVWFARLPRHGLDDAPRRDTRALRLATAVAVLACLAAAAVVGLAHGGPVWRIAFEATRTAMVAVAAVVITASVLWHLHRHRRAVRPPR